MTDPNMIELLNAIKHYQLVTAIAILLAIGICSIIIVLGQRQDG